MKVIKIILLIILVALTGILLSSAKYFSDSMAIHIHDTFFLVSYRQIILFFVEIAGLMLLFRILFKKTGKK